MADVVWVAWGFHVGFPPSIFSARFSFLVSIPKPRSLSIARGWSQAYKRSAELDPTLTHSHSTPTDRRSPLPGPRPSDPLASAQPDPVIHIATNSIRVV